MIITRLELHTENSKPQLVFMDQIEEIGTDLVTVIMMMIIMKMAIIKMMIMMMIIIIMMMSMMLVVVVVAIKLMVVVLVAQIQEISTVVLYT